MRAIPKPNGENRECAADGIKYFQELSDLRSDRSTSLLPHKRTVTFESLQALRLAFGLTTNIPDLKLDTKVYVAGWKENRSDLIWTWDMLPSEARKYNG